MFKSNTRWHLQKHINLNYKLKYSKLENKINKSKLSNFNNKLKMKPTCWILATVQANLSKTSKASLHIHVFNTLAHMENVVPQARPLFIRVLKMGGPRQGGGKTAID